MAAEQACLRLAPGDVDLIIATGSPFSAFRLAKKLAGRLGCPYVLDYRDPWTQNPHKVTPSPARVIRQEARLVAESAAVTIVSSSWGEALEHQHKLGSKLHVVTNGYDPEDLAHVKAAEFGHFAIVYTGVFYPPKRVITPVMQVLNRMKANLGRQNCEYFFHYYGPHGDHVRDQAQQHNVKDRVILHGEVPRPVALSGMRGAGAVVVITSVTEVGSSEEQGIVTGKIFEPIGLRVPILLISPTGSDAELMLRTTGLGRAFRANDLDGIAGFLRDLMSGRNLKAGNVAAYSWPEIATRLDRILRSVVEPQAIAATKPNVGITCR
jgi:glycosyltransferase involved in cell wall biosynthesis